MGAAPETGIGSTVRHRDQRRSPGPRIETPIRVQRAYAGATSHDERMQNKRLAHERAQGIRTKAAETYLAAQEVNDAITVDTAIKVAVEVDDGRGPEPLVDRFSSTRRSRCPRGHP